MNFKNIFTWVLRILAAVILLQTLYFKFTAAPESVLIFSKLGIEPWGRIGTGCVELVTGILLLINRTVLIGAIMGIGVMLGAIASHLLVLGISSAGDGGQLFLYANIVLVSCCWITWVNRSQGISMIKKIFPGRK